MRRATFVHAGLSPDAQVLKEISPDGRGRCEEFLGIAICCFFAECVCIYIFLSVGKANSDTCLGLSICLCELQMCLRLTLALFWFQNY
jgi:hypothetical protein